MAIIDVIEHAQAAILAEVPKIEVAPTYPTNKRLTSTTCNAYAENIRINGIGPGFVQTFFDLRLEVAIARNDVTENMYYLTDIPEAIAAVFTADPTIGGHCSTFDGEITANLVVDTLEGVPVIGYVIVIPNIKIQ